MTYSMRHKISSRTTYRTTQLNNYRFQESRFATEIFFGAMTRQKWIFEISYLVSQTRFSLGQNQSKINNMLFLYTFDQPNRKKVRFTDFGRNDSFLTHSHQKFEFSQFLPGLGLIRRRINCLARICRSSSFTVFQPVKISGFLFSVKCQSMHRKVKWDGNRTSWNR